jgi:hypothetical protein
VTVSSCHVQATTVATLFCVACDDVDHATPRHAIATLQMELTAEMILRRSAAYNGEAAKAIASTATSSSSTRRGSTGNVDVSSVGQVGRPTMKECGAPLGVLCSMSADELNLTRGGLFVIRVAAGRHVVALIVGLQSDGTAAFSANLKAATFLGQTTSLARTRSGRTRFH